MWPTDELFIGVYYDRQRAEEVSAVLREHGFQNDQIRVTLCEAHLEQPGPWLRAWRAALPVAGGLSGLLMGLVVSPLAVWPLAAVCLCTASGGFVGYLAALVHRSRSRHAPLLRGIVSVRPDGRAREAAAILLRYAGDAVSEQFISARSA